MIEHSEPNTETDHLLSNLLSHKLVSELKF